jgi:hypothetical protein
MGSHDVFRVLAVILAIATMAILIATKRVKNGWMCWVAIPVVAWLWYWVLVCLFMAYYMWRANGVR